MSSPLGPQFNPHQLESACRYIDSYWRRLERFHPRDEGTLVGVPRPYFVPSAANASGFAFEELYYWDTYFIAQGFRDTPRESLVKGMTEDLLSLMQRFGVIPNGGRTYFTSRSQPPLLTSLVRQVYEADGHKAWLEQAMDIAKDEYRRVWMGTAQPHWRNVFHGLSRYYDVNVLHDLAEAESGWDMTTRFGRECLNYIPVDLNALLYKYERDFEWAARELGYSEEADQWHKRALHRRAMMRQYLWDEEQGFYFDYNYVTGKRSKVWSLAGFYPMWVGLDDAVTATRVAHHLERFEAPGGVAATARRPEIHSALPTQWAYPNGWAPLSLIVCEALSRYDFHTEAERVARKWLATNLAGFERTGQFMEKYNVAHPRLEPAAGVYPSQAGFGWTNSVFVRLAQLYLRPEELPNATTKRVGWRQSLGSLAAPLRLAGVKLNRRHV